MRIFTKHIFCIQQILHLKANANPIILHLAGVVLHSKSIFKYIYIFLVDSYISCVDYSTFNPMKSTKTETIIQYPKLIIFLDSS